MPNDELKFFCENVKFLRITHALTKKEMARIMGVSVPTLTKIEAGNLPPRLNCLVLARLAQRFHVPMRRMFVGVEE